MIVFYPKVAALFMRAILPISTNVLFYIFGYTSQYHTHCMYIIHTLQHTYKYRCNTNAESQLFEASFVLVGKSASLVWSHCPTAWFPKLEDHRHTVLHMVVDVAMYDPGARVVQWCSEDDVAVRWD